MWCQVEIETGVDQGAVAGDRGAGNGEGVTALEGERAFRCDIAEGMAPANHAVQGGIACQSVFGAQTQCGEGYTGGVALTGQSGDAAAFAKAAGVQAYMGEIGERLEAGSARCEGVAEFAERLNSSGVIVRAQTSEMPGMMTERLVSGLCHV